MENNRVYKTISEVAQEIGLVNKKSKKLNTHTLRFWEKHFKQIKPKILSGNRRYYNEKDIEYIRLIHKLLKSKGFTINGAKKALETSSLNVDEALISSVKNKKIKSSIKYKTDKIKSIINKIKRKK